MRHTTILVAILAFVPLASATAQEPGDGRSWCPLGGTPETCKAFWITEFGALFSGLFSFREARRRLDASLTRPQ